MTRSSDRAFLLLLLLAAAAAAAVVVTADSGFSVMEEDLDEIESVVGGGLGKKQREFDYFALSLQWPGTMCNGVKKCCAKNGCCRGADTPQVFTIHGLWTDYNDGTWPECCNGPSFNPKEVEALQSALDRYWPSYSCSKTSNCHGGKGTFWGHEFSNIVLSLAEKHGTCAKPVILDEYNYFLITLNLYFNYNVTKVLNEEGYVPSNSEKYPVGGIIAAIENAFHLTPSVICQKDAIKEIRLCFYKDFKPRDCVLQTNRMVTSSESCPQYSMAMKMDLKDRNWLLLFEAIACCFLYLANEQGHMNKCVNVVVPFIYLETELDSSLELEEPKSDSCNINLNLRVPIPFDITNLHCLSVWDSQSFILRYVQTSRNTWSFILSTPYTNSYIAMGFSTNGGMVGSSAIVGWVISGGKGGGIKQYYLGGYAPNQVVPNKGNLNVVANSTFITLESNHLYMVFQLQTTTQPLSWIIFATGSIGLFPQAPSFALTKHLDKISQRIDYSKAKLGSSQGDSTSNSSSSSSSSQANGNNGSNGSLSSQGDSCGSNLNLNAPLFFDTTKLICIPVWNTQGFILRYSESSPNTWSFILSAPNPNSYIAIGFSPNGGMVGASAIVGWISTNNGAGGGMKQYYLAGTTPNMVVPDRGNLVILTNSTLITSQSSTLYMVFQLQTNQPLSRVIFAIGPSGTFPSSPSFALSMHQDKFSMTLDYSTGSSSSSENPSMNLKKSHGLLNIVAWGILVIMGAIVARYFKEWDPFWFYFHASVQSLGFIIGIIGVISGLVLNNQLQVDVSLHKALGIIILVLACLQMMALLARPNKASKMRKYWNLYHHNTGRVLIILAIANIFYGIHLGREGNAWKVGYGIVLAILLFIGFLFEINMWSSLEEDDD
ncbi:hypothetical protein AHAS_Ahas12G0024100 [Arachis hypogaea]